MNKIEFLGGQIINKDWKKIADNFALGAIMIATGVSIYTSEPVLNRIKIKCGMAVEKIMGKGIINLD